MAAQVNGDIDFHLAQPARDLIAVQRAKIMEAVEAFYQTGADAAVIGKTGGNADHLKVLAVMAFDQGSELERHGMLTEIGRNVGKPDAIMAIAFAVPQRRHGRWRQGAGGGGRTGQLQPLVVAQAQEGQRRCKHGRLFDGNLRRAVPVA